MVRWWRKASGALERRSGLTKGRPECENTGLGSIAQVGKGSLSVGTLFHSDGKIESRGQNLIYRDHPDAKGFGRTVGQIRLPATLCLVASMGG